MNATKSILLVYGGWEGHKPEEFKDLFLPWLEDQDFDVPEVMEIMKRGILWAIRDN